MWRRKGLGVLFDIMLIKQISLSKWEWCNFTVISHQTHCNNCTVIVYSCVYTNMWLSYYMFRSFSAILREALGEEKYKNCCLCGGCVMVELRCSIKMVKKINKRSSGCIISRHLTADKLMLQQFIFVFRNPRVCCGSWYHHVWMHTF
jgi:hypothetical protein